MKERLHNMESADLIVEKIRTYGADINGAMCRMLNDKDFYVECISNFLLDDTFKKLKQSLEDNNLSEAFDAAHTLKGVSANLGLTPLYNIVCEMVEPLRKKEVVNYKALYQELEASRDKLAAIMN